MYRLAAVTIVSLAACLWSATAALGWGVVEVPDTAGYHTDPMLVAGRGGTTVIGLLSSRGFAVSRVADGAPRTPVLLRAATRPFGESGVLAFTPRRRLVAAGTESFRGQRIWLAEGPPGGPLGPERTIARTTRAATSTTFAASTRGDIAVAVSMTNKFGSGVLRAVVRSPRGAVRSYNIIRGQLGSLVGLAFNHRGDLLVAGSLVQATDPSSTDARYTVAARLLPASGRPGRLRRVARIDSFFEDAGLPTLDVALGDDRRALVGWDLLPCGAGGGCGTSVLGFATAGRGARGWRAHRLATVPGTEFGLATPVLVAISRTHGRVVWGVSHGGQIEVRSAAVHGRRLGRARPLSTPGVDARPSALAINAHGAATILWTERAAPPGEPGLAPARVRAVTRATAGPFGPPETVWDPPVPLGTRIALLLHPFTGRPMAAGPSISSTDNSDGPVLFARG